MINSRTTCGGTVTIRGPTKSIDGDCGERKEMMRGGIIANSHDYLNNIRLALERFKSANENIPSITGRQLAGCSVRF